MNERIFILLKIFTYFALFPIVYRSLMAVNFTKLFKKNYVGEIRVLYIFIAIVITKIVGDFFLDIMDLFMLLFNNMRI